ncbi:MAG: hypothetical protein Ct9H300mP27_10860 [Chloroflexota bacterium]|nr:MAG: hypothetical protein Ct9H300mP27_10860 [Chloroflexota bacterium]
MNIRLSFFLVIVLILFGGTYLVFQFTDSSKRNQFTAHGFLKVDDDSINHIQITYDGLLSTMTKNQVVQPGLFREPIKNLTLKFSQKKMERYSSFVKRATS